MSDLLGGEVGYWKLDDGSGTNAADSSGSGRTGTLINTPTWLSSPGNAIQFPNPYGLTLNGTNQRVEVANFGSTFDFNGAFTIALWFQQASALQRELISNWKSAPIGGVSNHGIILEIFQGSPRFVYRNNGTDIFSLMNLSATATAGTWHHLVVLYDPAAPSANARVYLDGSLLTPTANATATFTITGRPLLIGDLDPASTARPWNGNVDDVRVFNRAISSDEVTVLASGGPVVRRGISGAVSRYNLRSLPVRHLSGAI